MVVPLKSFALAKSRLRGEIADVEVLARELAAGVLRATSPLPTFIVTESDDVELFAKDHSLPCLRSASTGLNAAVHFAYEALSPQFARVMIVHGDLRNPEGVATFDPPPGVTIVTDQHGVGTNVLVLPTKHEFLFQYGPNSRLLHRRESLRLRLPLTEIDQGPWCFDIDEPGDLLH